MMKKDQGKKVQGICFRVASVCFYLVAILKFLEKDRSQAVVFLCLGSALLCLSSARINHKET